MRDAGWSFSVVRARGLASDSKIVLQVPHHDPTLLGLAWPGLPVIMRALWRLEIRQNLGPPTSAWVSVPACSRRVSSSVPDPILSACWLLAALPFLNSIRPVPYKPRLYPVPETPRRIRLIDSQDSQDPSRHLRAVPSQFRVRRRSTRPSSSASTPHLPVL
jgi:hypothetical protein